MSSGISFGSPTTTASTASGAAAIPKTGATAYPGSDGLNIFSPITGYNTSYNPVGGIIPGSVSPDVGQTAPLPNFNNPESQLSWLYKQQWSNYLQQYAPQENLQLGLVSDAGNALERQQAQAGAAGAYANGQPLAQLKRQALSYGTKISPTQEASFKQKTNLQAGLDQANAYNTTNSQQIDRAFGVIGQGGYSPGGSVSNPQTIIPGG